MAWNVKSGQRLRDPILPWRELPAWLRVLRVAAAACCVVFLGLMITVGTIETAALHQPAVSDHLYLYPHSVKGTIRYFSADQERVYRLAKPLLLPSLGIMLLLLGVSRTGEHRLSKRRLQAALQQVASRTEESWRR